MRNTTDVSISCHLTLVTNKLLSYCYWWRHIKQPRSPVCIQCTVFLTATHTNAHVHTDTHPWAPSVLSNLLSKRRSFKAFHMTAHFMRCPQKRLLS